MGNRNYKNEAEFKEALSTYLEGEGKGKRGEELAEGVARVSHKGQKRKGAVKEEEMIKHPIEVGQILKGLGYREEVVISGYLHDTVEDTYLGYDDIGSLFGEEVVKLVASNSEDKSKSWEERKEHTIGQVSVNSEEEQSLLIADKYSNLKESYESSNGGEVDWSDFKRGEELQRWYFEGIKDELIKWEGKVDVKKGDRLYSGYKELVKKVFKNKE